MLAAIGRIACCVILVGASVALAQQGPGGTGPGQRVRRDRPLYEIRSDQAEEARRSARNLADRLESLTPERRAEAYLAESERHRAQALALARLARCGAAFPAGAAARIREALRFDLHTWRDAFLVSGPEWQAIRDAWLVDRQALTAGEWAERRALWFRERDSWIASRGELPGALRPEGREAARRSAARACAALAFVPASAPIRARP